jgi:hypothetical protein
MIKSEKRWRERNHALTLTREYMKDTCMKQCFSVLAQAQAPGGRGVQTERYTAEVRGSIR